MRKKFDLFQNRITIKKRLYTSFFLLLFIPTIFIGIFSYFNSKNQLEHEIMDNAYQQIKQLDENITTELSTKMKQVDKLRKDWGDINNAVSDDFINATLENYQYFYDDIDSIFYATKKGKYVQKPEGKVADNYDPTASEWFIRAEERLYSKYTHRPRSPPE